MIHSIEEKRCHAYPPSAKRVLMNAGKQAQRWNVPINVHIVYSSGGNCFGGLGAVCNDSRSRGTSMRIAEQCDCGVLAKA
jgi:hypothetical protein